MAEILTIDNQSDVEVIGDAGELNADEEESLKLGEELVSQQEQLLAGKYKDAEALEKAYIELEKKLGGQDQEEITDEAEVDTEAEYDEDDSYDPNDDPAVALINDASEEYWANDQQLTPETIEKFSEMSSRDLLNAYVQIYGNESPAQAADVSDADVNAIQNAVGGEQQYADIVNWASSNLDPADIQAFDSIIDGGNRQAIQLAVAGLKSQYDEANGYEGRMLSGKAPYTGTDVFRSQAELVKAMNDPRYDNDPAYRQDIVEKLDRSDLQY